MTEHVLNRFIAGWLAEDLDAVTACLTEDVVYSTSGRNGTAQTYRGREDVAKVFADQLGADPDLHLESPVLVGDTALGRWSYAPALDGSVLRGVDVYTLRDGLIAGKDVFSKLT